MLTLRGENPSDTLFLLTEVCDLEQSAPENEDPARDLEERLNSATTQYGSTDDGGQSAPENEMAPCSHAANTPNNRNYLDNRAGGATDRNNPENNPETRSAPITSMEQYQAFEVSAYICPGNWNPTAAQLYIDHIQVSPNTEGFWIPSPEKHWPGAGKTVRFFACAPYECPGVTPTQTDDKTPDFVYTVPENVADQKDLLVAASAQMNGDADATVELSFKHALTAVQFVTGDKMLKGRISRISLKNVYGKAICKMDNLDWTPYANKTTYSQTLNLTTDSSTGQPVVTEAQTFMMIPQTLPAGALIEVEFTDMLSNTKRTMTAAIAGTTWTRGKKMIYHISTTGIAIAPVLTVTGPGEYTYQGGTQNYSIASYKSVTRPGDPAKNIPLAWTAEFSTDGGQTWTDQKPAWLTTFTAAGVGGTSTQTFPAAVAAQMSTGSPHNENLQKAPQVTNYDLSTSGGKTPVNTANCYLVNAPGTYSLPLVYGNAVKNGATNSSAYTSRASGGTVLSPFLNHLGAGITNPYIYRNANCTPANCCLIWQDEPGLIANVTLAADKQHLTFEVPQPTIKQGNAIVAVRDASNQIMWSWHIWVTDYKLGEDLKTVTNYQNKQYTFLPVNLGWCDATTANYAARNVQVRITQTETGATTTFTVNQKEFTAPGTSGNAPYYQWGRKDPMLAGLTGNLDKSCYTDDDKTNYKFNKAGLNTTSINQYILSPHCFNVSYCMDQKYYNLWSANNTVETPNDNPVIKTVYDPSPAGYCLPPSNAWTGFTTNGQNDGLINTADPWNNGWNFYCGLNFTGDTTFYPAAGYRSYSYGVVDDVDKYGYYWSAGSYNYAGSGRGLEFGERGISGTQAPVGVTPLYGNSRAYGFLVRPIKEQ